VDDDVVASGGGAGVRGCEGGVLYGRTPKWHALLFRLVVIRSMPDQHAYLGLELGDPKRFLLITWFF
jgi:hypothetical protein